MKGKPFLRRAVEKVWARIFDFLGVNIGFTVAGFLVCVWLSLSMIVYKLEHTAQGANITNLQDGIWWGMVTFLTVGYGDKYPVTAEGRIIASFLMIAGVGAVGILTAKISSYFLEQALREGRGLVDSSKLKNHFVVCGWKEEMHDLLTHILDFNPDLTADQIVLIANLGQSTVEEIKAHPRLRKINIIAADYYTEINLARAVPERARKVMILADRSPAMNGQVATVTEVDARTVMAAMSLSKLAKGTQVTAEILDPKMDTYLRLAGVTEIIYSREYSRLLLGNASGGTGVANIIFDLLDPKTTAFLTTAVIPDALYGKTYKELKVDFDSRRIVVLGVLENSGNAHQIKELALRNAQKTADVSKLLQNLKSVKELKCNNPVFNPEDNYIVHEGCMAIVIENRKTQRQIDYEQIAA
ncbi:MAG: potassium channel family protein [Bacteriovoracia bacterium]